MERLDAVGADLFSFAFNNCPLEIGVAAGF